MPLWFWLVVGLVLVGLVLALLVPLRLELSAEARAEPDGGWAAAGGVALGPIALSSVGARGVPASMHVFVFGKRRFSRELSDAGDELGDAAVEAESDEAEPEREARRPGRLRRWLWERVDPFDGLAWLLGERRRLRWELDVDVSYSFRDVAMTGKLLAGVYVLTPFLPHGVRLKQTPVWESVDRGALQASGTVRIFAGLVLWDLIWYMLRQSIAPKRTRRRDPASQVWPKPKSSTS